MQIYSTFKQWIKKEWKIWRYLWHKEIMCRPELTMMGNDMFDEGDVVRMRTNEKCVIVWKGIINGKTKVILKTYDRY